MHKKIKETFGQIHAEPGLKTHTKEFIASQAANGIHGIHGVHDVHSQQHARSMRYKYLVPTAAAFLLCLLLAFSGYRAYFTRVSIISIDINPSIELTINRFGKVIASNSYNDDGARLEDSLHLKFMDYKSALDELFSSETITDCLRRNETLSISVIGRSEQESKEILADIETHIPSHPHTYCHTGSFDDADEAHSMGLSVGKYQALLKLQETCPDMSAEDIKGLTMRQIRELIIEPESHTTNGRHYKHGHE